MHAEARARLKKARRDAGLTLRQLAESIGVSTSLLSQIERGESEPSVASLYALSSRLELSLDALLDPTGGEGGATATPTQQWEGPVIRRGTRNVLNMSSGVTWEQLTHGEDAEVDALLVTYEPGSRSSTDGQLVTHAGTEYAYVIEGELTLSHRFNRYVLCAGDSLAFSSSDPHMYSNEGSEVARAVFFVAGRTDVAGSSVAPPPADPRSAVDVLRLFSPPTN
jgi:transcriptional regulator with XRE-family HTH domain